MTTYQYPYLTEKARTNLKSGLLYTLSASMTESSYIYQARGSDSIYQAYIGINEVITVDGSRVAWLQLKGGAITYTVGTYALRKSPRYWSNPWQQTYPFGRLIYTNNDFTLTASSGTESSPNILYSHKLNPGNGTLPSPTPNVYGMIENIFLQAYVSALPSSGEIVMRATLYTQTYTANLAMIRISPSGYVSVQDRLSAKQLVNPGEVMGIEWWNTSATAATAYASLLATEFQ